MQKTNVAIHEIHTKNDLKIQSSSDAIILDAIFGLGLNKPLNKEIGEIINFLNQSLAIRVAVDIPSGLFCDTISENTCVFQADFVLSFELPKLCFLCKENQDFVGRWDYRSIGLSSRFITKEPSDYFWIEKKDIQLKKRKKHHYKNLSGHVIDLWRKLWKNRSSDTRC